MFVPTTIDGDPETKPFDEFAQISSEMILEKREQSKQMQSKNVFTEKRCS